MKTLLAMAALIGVAYYGLSTVPTAEAAQFTVGNNPPYGGSQCMDVVGGNLAARSPVQAWACSGWLNQQWTMQGLSIQGVGLNCLDVVNGGTAAGTPVNIYPCHGGGPQQWYYSNGFLVNIPSRRCLDAGSQVNGTQLRINDCAYNVPGQMWQIK